MAQPVISAFSRPSAENKLNSYIVSHNEYSASSRIKGMLPYTRIVSYTQGQGFAQPAINDVKK